MNANFWRGKRVLITGHTGFKGSWLSIWLNELGANVTGLALPPDTNPSLFEAANLAEDIDSHFIDIRNQNDTLKLIQKTEPEIVFHMAAQPLVRLSYEQPVETYATNVMGTVHVLDAIRKTPSVRSCVVVTTDKCYENQEKNLAFQEGDRLGGHDPYSNSKACAELVTEAYRNSFFSRENFSKHKLGLATGRAGNVIGGGDWAKDRLVPDIAVAFSKKEPVVVRNPNSIRPWQHVLEPLSGYVMLAEKLYTNGSEFSESWNFGPDENDAVNVKSVVVRISSHWPNSKWEITQQAGAPHEATYLRLDSTKSRQKLHWLPKWHINETLKVTIDWYKGFYENPKKARELTLADIAKYTEKN